MNKKKWMHRGVALALSAVMTTGVALPASVAEAGAESIIGAVIGGAVAANEMNQQIKYYNTTEEGRQALFKELQEKYGVYYRWDLNNQLDRIFTNLTAAIGSMDATIYDRPYNYFINQQDQFNAFCTLGHNMSVNVGLYSYLSNEDEIAVVLAHEMGHGQKDHPAKGMKRSLGPAVLASATGTVLGAIAANIWSGQGLTKPMEWEADNLAFEYIARSPYNPGATAAVWQRVVYVNKKVLVTPAAAGGMSSAERAYFVMGNLSAAYKNGHAASGAYVDGRTVMLGAQPIISCTSGDQSPEEIANLLNNIK